MGLNPEAGAGDSAHQYFGESYLARDVRLAPQAVVLLFHLCYASGNSEPGLPEGDLATGQQRVDNYAAGWIAAGAAAVLAEGLGGPEYYVRRILAGDGTIEGIWRRAPTAHGHVLAFPSVRTPGMTALMDPTRKSSGFYRSLVGRIEMRANEVARGAARVRTPGGNPVLSSATPVGPAVKDVTLKGTPTVGSALRVTVVLEKAARSSAKDLGIGIRWDPISLEPPSSPAATSANPSPTAPAGVPGPPAATPEPTPSSPPAATPEPTPSSPPAAVRDRPAAIRDRLAAPPAPTSAPAAPADASPAPGVAASAAPEAGGPSDAPPIILISPEVPGTLVSVTDVKVKGSRISADVIVPLAPGLYRLSVTLHDGDGIAFGSGIQERMPAFTVRVTGAISTVVSAIDRLSVVAGAAVDLPVSVANTGQVAWVADRDKKAVAGSPTRPVSGTPYATLVGQWVRLDGSGVGFEALAASATITPPPGDTARAMLTLNAPPEPGAYLLVLDVVSPLYGSLAALGGAPMVVRIDVTAPDVGGASPGGGPADQPGAVAPPRSE